MMAQPELSAARCSKHLSCVSQGVSCCTRTKPSILTTPSPMQVRTLMVATYWSSAAVWLLVACSRLFMTIMGYVTTVATILAAAPAAGAEHSGD